MLRPPALSRYIAGLPFFDSHSHLAGFDVGGPVDDRQGRTLAQLLANDYLAYLAGSCCDVPITAQKNAPPGSGPGDEAEFRALLPLLAECRALSTYAVIREGLRALHGFRGADITPANWRALNDRIVATYQRHGERGWQREVARRAGVVRQVQICQLPYVLEHWPALPPAERAAQQALLLPALVLDGFAFTGFAQNRAMRERALALVGAAPTTYADYLAFCRTALDRFVAGGGRAVKLLAAYVRPLAFAPVPASVAEPLFARGVERLAPDELRQLQDHLVWELLALAVERRLPLLVHTGYAIPTAWGDPELLLPLLQSPRLKGLRLGLCHSGWPRHAGAMLMARTYRGCYLDISWNPMLSPASARTILSEALDMVPMNKLMLGTDCGTAESFYGTVQLTRRLVAEVLADKVRAGQFALPVARRAARCLFYGNAAAFFGEPLPAGAPPLEE